MAYSKSVPFKNFVYEVDEIIKILKKLKLQSSSTLNGKFKEYILFSCVFLAHAEIENYIEDIFKLYIRNLNQKKFLDLNENLRSFLIYKFFQNDGIKNAKDEKSIINLIKRESTNNSKHFFDKDLSIISIKGEFIYETYKYPSAKNIQKIYKRIGCDDIFDMTSREIRRNAKTILEQLGTYRTSLAHTASLTNVTVDDIIAALNDIKLFVRGLDKVLYKRIVTDYNQNFWRGLV